MEIIVSGHKAKVEHVFTRTALPPWYDQDEFTIWIEFTEPVGSTLSYGISLPVKKYTKEEFLELIQSTAEIELHKHLIEYHRQKEINRNVAQRKAVLDKMACDLQEYLKT